jgi:hypothetical protein
MAKNKKFPKRDVEIVNIDKINSAGMRIDQHINTNIIVDGKEYYVSFCMITILDSTGDVISQVVELDDMNGCPTFKMTKKLQEQIIDLSSSYAGDID